MIFLCVMQMNYTFHKFSVQVVKLRVPAADEHAIAGAKAGNCPTVSVAKEATSVYLGCLTGGCRAILGSEEPFDVCAW